MSMGDPDILHFQSPALGLSLSTYNQAWKALGAETSNPRNCVKVLKGQYNHTLWTLNQGQNRVMGKEEPEAARALKAQIELEGVEFLEDTSPQEVFHSKEAGYRLVYTQKGGAGEEGCLLVDALLLATGAFFSLQQTSHFSYFLQCNAMQCNAMQCNAMQCNAMQCNAMQCSASKLNQVEQRLLHVYPQG